MSENNAQSATPATPPTSPCRSLEEAISEVDRELKVRLRVYDRWVADGKLSTVDARDRVERLQSALAYLNRQFDLASAS